MITLAIALFAVVVIGGYFITYHHNLLSDMVVTMEEIEQTMSALLERIKELEGEYEKK